MLLPVQSAGNAERWVWEVAVPGALRCDMDVGEEQVLAVDDRRSVGDPTTGIGSSSRRWSTLARSVRVFSHAAGLKISPRLAPSI
jgi:hypothetical protein